MNFLANFSDNAKVWVYFSKSKINSSQKQIISDLSVLFMNEWTSHGEKVHGDVVVYDDCFLVICAEVSSDSMCGRAVDANVRFVKDIESKTGLSLLDRMTAAYRNIEGEIMISTFHKLKESMDSKSTNDILKVFNPMVYTKKEFTSSFEQDLEKSWMS